MMTRNTFAVATLAAACAACAAPLQRATPRTPAADERTSSPPKATGRPTIGVAFGGEVVRASASPAYLGSEDCVDPEEAFVASLSACHMLTFLALCTKERLVVESYEDDAVGHLEKDANGKMAITRVILRPRIVFSGGDPSQDVLDKLHHDSHEMCFIASSVKTEVTVEAV